MEEKTRNKKKRKWQVFELSLANHRKPRSGRLSNQIGYLLRTGYIIFLQDFDLSTRAYTLYFFLSILDNRFLALFVKWYLRNTTIRRKIAVCNILGLRKLLMWFRNTYAWKTKKNWPGLMWRKWIFLNNFCKYFF